MTKIPLININEDPVIKTLISNFKLLREIGKNHLQFIRAESKNIDDQIRRYKGGPIDRTLNGAIQSLTFTRDSLDEFRKKMLIERKYIWQCIENRLHTLGKLPKDYHRKIYLLSFDNEKCENIYLIRKPQAKLSLAEKIMAFFSTIFI